MPQGRSGLEGAIPGGDGRALAAYRAEYRGDVIQRMDSLSLVFQEGWTGADVEALQEVYADDAWIVPPSGAALHTPEDVERFLRRGSSSVGELRTWRNDLLASGEMAFLSGRYEARARRGARSQAGIHATVAKRVGRDWKIRAQVFLPLEGGPGLLRAEPEGDEPAHITPEDVRSRYMSAPNDAPADWAVNRYYEANSTLSAFRHSWARDDVAGLQSVLTPAATVRLPLDVPRVGGAGVEESLTRLLAATGELHMSILEFDASERLSFCLGRYVLSSPAGVLTGYYVAALRNEDDGQRIRGLIFTGAGAMNTQPQ